MVQLGIDNLFKKVYQPLKKYSWGMLSNDAALNSQGQHSRVALLKEKWNLQFLFSPEHGLNALGIDGSAQSNHIDPLTQLNTYSLYGPQFSPPAKVLEKIDGVIMDLPDTGLRFYTYLWSMTYLMEACQNSQKKLLLLDRPNPISGHWDLVEGPILEEPHFSSFIGRWALPIRHSMTLGELALYWQKTRLPDLDLEVIPCENWKRHYYFRHWSQPFLAPSPAINMPETYLTYPALCFLEGLNLSEGRGTKMPFQQFGAPWLDHRKLLNFIEDCSFPGINLSLTQFQPASGRYAHQVCNGVFVEVNQVENYRPIQLGLGILASLKFLFPEKVKDAPYPTHANPSGAKHIDLLTGSQKVMELLNNDPLQLIQQSSTICDASLWVEEVKSFAIYD